MLCMKCKTTVDTTYFVSKEDANGTGIEGPLVCLKCFVETFPKKQIPQPALKRKEDSPQLPRRLSFDATLPDPANVAYDPARGQSRVMSLDEALQAIADQNRQNRVGFSWGPLQYNKLWADAIRNDSVIKYARTTEKDCEQGLGIYMAKGIWNSATFGNSDDTSVLVVHCVNTPTLIYSTKKERAALAAEVVKRTNVSIDGDELYCYLSSKACDVKAIKVYGNYWALTTGNGVTATFDIPSTVTKADISNITTPQALAYLKKKGLV